MEKLKLGKHKHILTDIVKVAMLFLTLCLPLFAVLSKTLYVTCNRNAKDSYSAEQSLTYKLEETENLYNKSMYYFETNNTLIQQRTLPYINIQEINKINGNINIPDNPNKFRIYYNGNNQSYSIEIQGTTTVYTVIGNNTSITNIQFNFIKYEDEENTYPNNILYYNYSNQQSLDNAFYYAFNQLEEEPLFNWTTNTGTYTAVNAMFTGLDMGANNPIALLLTYWLMILMIYVVVDIVIVCFTKLTHYFAE